MNMLLTGASEFLGSNKFIIRIMLNEFSKFKKINSKLEFRSIKCREHEKMNCTPDTSYLNSIGWCPKYSLQQGVKKQLRKYLVIAIEKVKFKKP